MCLPMPPSWLEVHYSFFLTLLQERCSEKERIAIEHLKAKFKTCIRFSSNFPKNLLVFQDALFFPSFLRGREGEREGEKHQCVVASWQPM